MPLASQLILMPNGAVAAVQQEVPPAQSPGVHADADQVSGNHVLWRSPGAWRGDHRQAPYSAPLLNFIVLILCVLASFSSTPINPLKLVS